MDLRNAAEEQKKLLEWIGYFFADSLALKSLDFFNFVGPVVYQRLNVGLDLSVI